jgi:hypothetical protein
VREVGGDAGGVDDIKETKLEEDGISVFLQCHVTRRADVPR